LETVRKRKATPAPETTETIEELVVLPLPESEMEQLKEKLANRPVGTEVYNPQININTSDTVDFLVSQKKVQDIIAEAPALFGHSPTVQQIEDFKQKEYAWRTKLNSL
jgi:hypothetical protein